MLQFLKTVCGLALAHGLAGLFATLIAGFSNHPWLLALARILLFPGENFPAAIQSHGFLSFAAYAVSCLCIWFVLCGAIRLAFLAGGTPAAGTLVLLLIAGFLALLYSLSNPAPDWHSAAHRYLQDHVLFLPNAIRESAEEREMEYAMHKNLNPTAPFVPSPTGRWYWGYRNTLSGNPEYYAVVIASPEIAVPTREDFLREMENQRAQGWKAPHWDVVKESDHWILESALPDRSPLPAHERNRLIRVVAKAPSEGVWIGLMALQRKMTGDDAADIVRRAMESVQPIASDNGPDSVVPLRPDLSGAGTPASAPPKWIPAEMWAAHALDQSVHIPPAHTSLEVVGRLSACSRKITLFLWNPSAQPMRVRVLAPDKNWMFTASGNCSTDPSGNAKSPFRLEPSMPLPLPKDLGVDPQCLVLIQLTDLSPSSSPPTIQEP